MHDGQRNRFDNRLDRLVAERTTSGPRQAPISGGPMATASVTGFNIIAWLFHVQRLGSIMSQGQRRAIKFRRSTQFHSPGKMRGLSSIAGLAWAPGSPTGQDPVNSGHFTRFLAAAWGHSAKLNSHNGFRLGQAMAVSLGWMDAQFW